MSFYEELKADFSFLIKTYNFQIKDNSSDQHNFGNSLILMESTDFKIRFIKDRGQLFIDIGVVDFDFWYDLRVILECFRIINHEEKSSIDQATNLTLLKPLLRKYFDKVKIIFSPLNIKDTIKKLDKFEAQKVKERFNI